MAPVTFAAVGSIKDTLQALLPRIKQREDSGFQDSYVERHRKSLAAQAKRATPGRHGLIYGQYLTSIIDRLADEDADLLCEQPNKE